MGGLKDNYGAEIGMRVTCQRCGTTTFRKQTGYNSVDATTQSRHSFYDQFEPMPEDWRIKHDLGGWLCPECIKQYDQMIKNFQLEDKDYRVSELPEDPESKAEKSICEYKKLTEEEALEKLNHQKSITKEEARDILFSLCDAVKERAENLPERVVSSWDYYKGEFNGMDVAIRLFSKLK